MKRILLALVLMMFGGTVLAAESKPESQGLEAAKAIAKITGVAVSPLLGTAAIGAWDWWTTPKEKKAKLAWYTHPGFWVPALLLVVVVAAKDSLGTILPPGAKKPLDVAETVENKISGLVAAGAVVPLVAAIFGNSLFQSHGLNTAGFAAFDFASLLNIITVPLALVAFALVWLVCHAINVLILISPFGAVDAALKGVRTFLLGLVTTTSFVNPWAGAVLSLIIILLAYFCAGWSFRMLVFGSVYVWDFCTVRRRRFRPAPNANWMFTARQIEKTPIRTYGKLLHQEDGALNLEYRPWLFLAKRKLTLPAGQYAVGRGLFYPEIMQVDGEEEKTMLVLPPRYRTHEAAIAEAYALMGVRDVGLLKGFKAIWNWLKGLFGLRVVSAATP